MKRVVILILLFLTIFSLGSETLTHSSLKYEYEQYSEEEFPLWSRELRRAESIFFGSFVFTIPISTLSFSLLRNANLINNSQSIEKEALVTLTTAAGLSLLITTIDWVLGRVQ